VGDKGEDMKFLLVILVCGHFDCHYERAGMYGTWEECVEAAGYNYYAPKRLPPFKCIELKGGDVIVDIG
jgi:hypothetical protein